MRYSLFQDEDVYTFFEPELPSESPPVARAMLSNAYRPSLPKFSASKSGSKSARLKKQLSMSTLEKRGLDNGGGASWQPTYRDRISLQEGSSVLDLKGDNYFSCAVARKRSNARYLLKTSDDVVDLLKDLSAHACLPST